MNFKSRISHFRIVLESSWLLQINQPILYELLSPNNFKGKMTKILKNLIVKIAFSVEWSGFQGVWYWLQLVVCWEMFSIWCQGSEGSSPAVEHPLVAMEMLPSVLSKPQGGSRNQSQSGRCRDPTVCCYRCTFYLAGTIDISKVRSIDDCKTD